MLVCLGDDPWLLGVDILIGFIRLLHDQSDSLAVLTAFEEFGYFGLACQHLCNQFLIIELLGQHAIKTLSDKAGTAAGDVDHLAYQI